MVTEFTHVLDSFDFIQHVDKATHVLGHTLDLVMQRWKEYKIFYSSKSTITLLKFYLSTSKSTSLKIYSSKSKK